MHTPVAFVDVDGVLNRLCTSAEAKSRGLFRARAWAWGHQQALWLDRADKARLMSLTSTFELGWGTTWEGWANLGPGALLGLPNLSVVAIVHNGERSKAPAVVRAAAGRPFVWFDDDTHTDEVCAPQPHLVINPDPTVGLTDEHITQAQDWWARVLGSHADPPVRGNTSVPARGTTRSRRARVQDQS